MAIVGGSFAVAAGAYREITLDTTGLTLEQIAAKLEDLAERPSLCHQCAHEMSDPELEDLTSLNVDGVEYVVDEDSGKWTAYQPK